MSKHKKERKEHKGFKIFSILVWLVAFISLCLLTYEIYIADILPSKYYSLLAAGALILIIIFLTIVRNKRSRLWLLIFNDLIFIVVIVGCIFGYNKLHDMIDFLHDTLDNKYETDIYYFVVNKDSTYKEVNDIKDKSVVLVDDIDNKEELERNIKKHVVVEYNYVESIVDYLYDLETNKELILFVNSGNYDAMVSASDTFEDNTRIIDTVEIEYKVVNEETGVDVTEDPFVIYLSGIDTRSGKLPKRSLSDVNIILVVNPQERTLLMVSTPRDFYVQVHGSTGLKDKLTHAGLRGGVKLSKATIEDLYDVEIPYYIRVNFNAVVKLVDAIGGITVTSEKSTSFYAAGSSCLIKPGDNKVDGTCALAFARDRHHFSGGDRKRGEHQEQVISRVIEKVTSSTTLLTKSSEILSSLEGTFETNISTDEITSLVKMQLDDMRGWTISTYNVNGSDAYDYTYSYPNRKLYVMIPDEKKVETAKTKIKAALATE